MERDDEGKPVSSRAGYAQWATHYDGQDNPMTAMVEHVVAQTAIDLSGAKVIELGCGTGRNALALQERDCASYLGIDNSPEMLAIGAARFGNTPSVEFNERDLRSDWWAGLGTFDVAIMSLVFEHFDRIDKVLGAIGHVVGNGGLLWILEIHPQLHSGGTSARFRSDDQTLLLPSFRHTTGDFARAFGETGWAPVATTDWYATEELTKQSAKLERYCGRPVLLELRARRASVRPQ